MISWYEITTVRNYVPRQNPYFNTNYLKFWKPKILGMTKVGNRLVILESLKWSEGRRYHIVVLNETQTPVDFGGWTFEKYGEAVRTFNRLTKEWRAKYRRLGLDL